jgi:hypothetical protein
MALFNTWSHEALVKFADAAQAKILAQEQLLLGKFNSGLKVDDELKSHWKDALSVLATLPDKKQEAFAMLVLAVSDCFTDENSAGVFIFHSDLKLTLATTGCTEFECAGIIGASNAVMQERLYDGAPPKEMMN